MSADEMCLVGWCPPCPERAYDPLMRRRVPSRYKCDPNFADVSLVEVDPAQSRQLMEKVAERTASHWIVGVRSLMRKEGGEALFFENEIGLSIKNHCVTVERHSNLANGRFGAV